jgi:hypothetical protein
MFDMSTGTLTHRCVFRALGRRRAFTITLLLVGIGAGAWLERQALLRGLADLWIVSDPVTRGDAVVVLGGSFNWRPFVSADVVNQTCEYIKPVGALHLTEACALFGIDPDEDARSDRQ